jgi:hypothetical protein
MALDRLSSARLVEPDREGTCPPETGPGRPPWNDATCACCAATPPAHREVHREEMLGVLLAAARPGQRTPGLGQTVNLAACGLAIRVRRIPGWLAADAGQDALAVVSLIAPALVVIFLVLERAAIYACASARTPVWLLVPFLPTFGQSVVVMIAWLAVVLIALIGCRRTAAAIASISLTLTLLILLVLLVLLTAIMQQSHVFPGGLVQFLPFADVPVVLASLAACSLVFSPGPRCGLATVGWRRACLMIAGPSAGFGFPSIVQLADPAAPVGDLAFRLLGVLAIAVAVAVTCVRSPAGRRVAGLMATGLLPSLAVTIPPARRSGGHHGALARQPARRRAGVARGDRLLAGAGHVGTAHGLRPGQACLASAETSRAIAWGITGRVGWPHLTSERARSMAVFAQVKTRRAGGQWSAMTSRAGRPC